MQGNDTVFCRLSTNSPCIDAGDPAWLDIPDQNNPDYALWPAMGMLRSDIGAYGGKGGRNPEGIDRIDDGYPTQFQLKQNYPNPFNPSTQIKFQISNSNFVTLEIYDLLGHRVATLVNEKLNAGIHTLEWTATGNSSGVYLYRLQAGNYSQTKKLILLK
jgi:hypothetical protein